MCCQLLKVEIASNLLLSGLVLPILLTETKKRVLFCGCQDGGTSALKIFPVQPVAVSPPPAAGRPLAAGRL